MQCLAIQPFHLVTDNATSCNLALPVVSFYFSTFLLKLKSTTTQNQNAHSNISSIRAYAGLQSSSTSLSLSLSLSTYATHATQSSPRCPHQLFLPEPMQNMQSSPVRVLFDLCNTCNPVHSQEFLNNSVPTHPTQCQLVHNFSLSNSSCLLLTHKATHSRHYQ